MMDMNIEAQKIRERRHQRAWSQAQLAQACGLGLRTIQRVEKTGSASPETVQALASVFECLVSDLIEPLRTNDCSQASLPTVNKQYRLTSRRKFGFGIAALGATLALGLGVTRFAHATDVHLTVRVLFDNQIQGTHRLVVKAGEPALIIAKEKFRLSITPTVHEQKRVFLTTLWDEFDAAAEPPQFSSVAKPKLLVENQQQAAFGLRTKQGQAVMIQITPEISSPKSPV